jgi:hypothetical protein
MKKENIQEIHYNRAQEVEKLSDQDKRVKKVCKKVFLGFFVCFLLITAINIVFDLIDYTDYIIAFFFAYTMTAIISFFGYWKFIRKETIPAWFFSSDDNDEDTIWDSPRLSESYESLRCRGRR